MKPRALFVSFAMVLLPSAAFAQEPSTEEQAPLPPPPIVKAEPPADTSLAERREEAPEGPPRFDFIRINAGPKIAYVQERGYDAFSGNDVFPMFSLDGTVPLVTSGKIVIAAGLGWETGSSKADTRGVQMRLATHRFAVPVEGRYHVSTALYVFVKAAPGVRAHLVDVEDPSAQASLTDTAWSVGADFSAGASILLGPRARQDKKRARFWLMPEVGYALASAATLRPNPDRDPPDVLGTDMTTSLRPLALSGFFWRASVGITF
jgi:hypothetical protein